MSVYIIAQLKFTHRELYDRYQSRFMGVFSKFKGKLLVADAHPVVLCVAFPVDALSLPIVADALKQSVIDHIRILAKGSSIGLAILRGPQDRFGGPRD